MDNIFKKLRQLERKPHAQKSFEQALFGGFAPWYLGVDEAPSIPVEPVKVVEEKTQVLEKLQDFVVNQLDGRLDDEIQFPGGAVKLKAPERVRVVKLNPESSPRTLPEELSAERPIFLCLGETQEPAQAELLTKMLHAMKLHEFSVWRIKEPSAEEEEKAWLEEMMMTVWHYRPVFILSVGALVTNIILGEKERLSRIHGQFFEIQVTNASDPFFPVTMVPIFHPEFLLINPKMKQSTWTDLQNVMSHLGSNTP
jgi:uracil-DNA glycosylase family 4